MPASENKAFEKLRLIADDFGATATKVNESSLRRKNHAGLALSDIGASRAAGIILLNKIRAIARENISLRDRHAVILNSFRIIEENLKRQSLLLSRLETEKSIGAGHSQSIAGYNRNLAETIRKGIPLLEKIIAAGNTIILHDSQIVMRRQFQKERASRLEKSARKVLRDAETAVDGSRLNSRRGSALSKRFRGIGLLVKKNNMKEIKKIMAEAGAGWKLAAKVNARSKSQFDFADRVNGFTRKLRDEAQDIMGLVVEKHRLFRADLEPIAELAVLVAVELMEYAVNQDNIRGLLADDAAIGPEAYRLRNDLAALITNACASARAISNLNFDMSGCIASNARFEESAVELTREEDTGYARISAEVERMTEAARYPVEGSARNITNGKELVKILSDIMKKR